MFKYLVLIFVFAATAHFVTGMNEPKSSHERDHQHENVHPAIKPEYLEAFRNYTSRLLKHPQFFAAFERTGAVSYDTFSVALLLANVNEGAFNVRRAGISKALNLPNQEIADAYSALFDNFLEDPNVKSTSTLYTTSHGKIVLGPNYQKLHTGLEALPLQENSSISSASINRQIGYNTQQRLANHLVPSDPFSKTATTAAAGVYVNTFAYENKWVKPFTPIGQKPFYTHPATAKQVQGQVPTLESVGEYPYYEMDRYSVVAIPLVGGKKHVVLVRPNLGVEQYIETCVGDIFKTEPAKWSKRYLRVQVPELNLVLGRNYQAQLDDLAKTEISCCGRPDSPEEVVDPATRHFIQPVVQVISTRFSAEGYELAVANGAQVSKRVHHAAPEDSTNKTFVDLPKPVDTHVESGNYSRASRTGIAADFFVNNPFFMYLHDQTLGASVAFTAVRSTFDSSAVASSAAQDPARHHVAVDIGTDFSEEAKVHRWNCHHKH